MGASQTRWTIVRWPHCKRLQHNLTRRLANNNSPQSALISALFAAAFSWYNITLQPYTVRAVWYSGLLLALAGISSAMQQSIALHRLSSNTNGLERVRNLLGYSKGGTWKARHLQIFMWQSAVMLLNVAIFLFILGLFIAILSGARDGTEDYRVRMYYGNILARTNGI